MIARTPCPFAECMWLSGVVATAPAPDLAVEVPPWCLPNWAVASSGYGNSLTVAQVIGAHVASHFPSERSVRMPSRAEVEQVEASPAAAKIPKPRTTAEEIEYFITPEGRRMVEEFMAEPGDDDFDVREVLAQNLDDAVAKMVGTGGGGATNV
jgi:hypothetical protein